MKITDIKAVYPAGKKKGTGAWQEYYWQIVVRVETDTGVVGYGYGGGGEPGKLIVNGHLRDALIGRTIGSVDDIRHTWDHLYFKSLPYGRNGIVLMALSGIDLALWDLLGKAEGKPVYDLIGSLYKDKVRAYATGGEPARVRDLGYTAVKRSHQWRTDADYDTAVAEAARCRELFGPDALLMFDCYMSWDAGVALRMREILAEYEPYWFEDLITPDHLANWPNSGRGWPCSNGRRRARFLPPCVRRHCPRRCPGPVAARYHLVRWDNGGLAYTGPGQIVRGAGMSPSRRRDLGAAPDRRDGLHGSGGDTPG